MSVLLITQLQRLVGSKIEKVPRGIRGEKSSKDMASSRNLVSTIGALASPKMGDGTRWEGWDPVNRLNHSSWMAIVTPTDRPKSVRNRYVIEVLVEFVCCHVACWVFSVGVGAFVIGLSQISSFFSYLTSNCFLPVKRKTKE